MTEQKRELIDTIIKLHGRIAQLSGGSEPHDWLALNLTITQFKTLLYIRFEGATNSKSLAGALKVSPPNVTGIVDRMVDQGLISRQENPDNRRMQILKITEKGEDLANRLLSSHYGYFSGILARMSVEELNSLIHGYRALVKAAECSGTEMEQSLTHD